MPNYDYYCPECDSMKEVTHGMFEEPEILCDECQIKMKKALTNLTYQLKGVGWVSKGTGTAPKPKKTTEHGVAVPSYMDGIVNKDLIKGKHT